MTTDNPEIVSIDDRHDIRIALIHFVLTCCMFYQGMNEYVIDEGLRFRIAYRIFLYQLSSVPIKR